MQKEEKTKKLAMREDSSVERSWLAPRAINIDLIAKAGLLQKYNEENLRQRRIAKPFYGYFANGGGVGGRALVCMWSALNVDFVLADSILVITLFSSKSSPLSFTL